MLGHSNRSERWDNEALQLLDMLVHPLLGEVEGASPPASGETGVCFIVPPGAVGEWSGKDGQLTCLGESGWRFVAPFEGLRATRVDGSAATYRNGRWDCGIIRGSTLVIDGQPVIGKRSGPIADPANGTIMDIEARRVLVEVLKALRSHGLVDSAENIGA